MKILFNEEKKDLILIFSALYASGSLLVLNAPQFVYTFCLLVLGTISATRLITRRVVISPAAIIMFAALSWIAAFHFFSGDGPDSHAALGFFVRLTVGFLLAITIRNFVEKYIHVMTFLAYISFIFYLPPLLLDLILNINIGSDLKNLFSYLQGLDHSTSGRIITPFQTYSPHSFLRNSGIFWEPGAFSGYLCFALVLASVLHHQGSKPIAKNTSYILIGAILSTQSTQGIFFLIFWFVVFGSNLIVSGNQSRGKAIPQIIIILILISILPVLFNSEFFWEKTVELYGRAEAREAGWHLSRFGAMIFDFYFIQQKPWLGHGFSVGYLLDADLVNSTRIDLGNGLSGMVRQIGFIGFFITAIGLLINLYKICNNKVWSLLLALLFLSVLGGQYYQNYLIFWALIFVHNHFGKKHEELKFGVS